MSDMNAYESDMGWLSKLSDDEIEQVISGDYAGDDASLTDLAAFARDAKATFASAPDDATRVAHVTAMAEAAADLDVAPVRTSKPAASSPFRRVKLVLTSLFASLIAKVALVGVALAATTGGLAATGSLPEPAQEALARASEKVGFELPAGDDAEEEEGQGESGVPDELPEGTEGSSAPSVLDVIRSWGDEKGCEFGHAVATAAGEDPGPCEDQQGGNGKGRPEGAGEGRPEGAGKPEGTPEGKPGGAGEGQGKPEGTPSSKPEGAGKPEGTPGGDNPGAGGNGADDADRGGNANGNGGVGAPSGSNGSSNANGGGKPSFVPGG